jgi:hypothetical protein
MSTRCGCRSLAQRVAPLSSSTPQRLARIIGLRLVAAARVRQFRASLPARTDAARDLDEALMALYEDRT